MVPARLTKPKTFWQIDLNDWLKLHPENMYRFDRKSARQKLEKLDTFDARTEYALGRVKAEEVFSPERRGRNHDLNKLHRYALHEPSKKVKYVLNPLVSPDKFTKQWKDAYEEKFTKKRYLKEINETIRKSPFLKERKEVRAGL